VTEALVETHWPATFMVIEYKGDHLDCIQNQQNNVDAEHL
jgi:hypothetical protein